MNVESIMLGERKWSQKIICDFIFYEMSGMGKSIETVE